VNEKKLRGEIAGERWGLKITGKITGMRHMASADLDTRPIAIAVGQLITSSDGAHRARFFCFHFRPFCRHLFFLRLPSWVVFFFIVVVFFFVVVFVVVAALVPLPFVFTAAIFFSLFTSGLYRIAHPVSCTSSLCPSFYIIIISTFR
jgi:hypothetical protein